MAGSPLLPLTSVTTPTNGVQVGPVQDFRMPNRGLTPANMCIQALFVLGAGGVQGGIAIDAWVQTSIDLGITWIDVAQFHFTNVGSRALFNLSALTPVTAQFTSATDGTMAINTAKDGIVGPLWRVKYAVLGGYGAGSTLQIDAQG